MVRKVCCCGTNLKAALILSILFIISRVISVAIAGGLLAAVNSDAVCGEPCESNHPNDLACEDVDNACEKVTLVMKLIVSFLTILLLLDIGLLVGSIKKVSLLLWSWVVGAGLSIIVLVSLLVTIAVSVKHIFDDIEENYDDPDYPDYDFDDAGNVAATVAVVFSVIPAIVYTIITLWIMAAVYQAIKEVKELKG